MTTVREASKKAKEMIMVRFQKLQKIIKMHGNLVPKKQPIATYLVHDGPVVILTYYRLLHLPQGENGYHQVWLPIDFLCPYWLHLSRTLLFPFTPTCNSLGELWLAVTSGFPPSRDLLGR